MIRDGLDNIGAVSEDQFKKAELQAPSRNSHFNLHPKQTDSIFKQIYDCRDMIYDPHWEIKNLVKSSLKGAIVGGLLGSTVVVAHKTLPTLVLKKMLKHVRDTTFGSLNMMKHIMLPHAMYGGMLGATWYFWYHQVWAYNSTKGGFIDNVLGYGLFSMGASAFLFHPKLYWAGFLGGCLLGFADWFMREANNGSNKDTVGYYATLGSGLSQEEKIAQKNRDAVFELSQLPEVKYAQVYRGI